MAIIAGAGQDGVTTFDVDNSLLLDRVSGAKITNTFGSTTNRKTFTVSLWTKKVNITQEQNLVFAGDLSGSNPFFDFRFNSDQTINWYQSESSGSSAEFNLITTRKFRDPLAWYHIVMAVDTTQGTSSNRVKLYVNGVQETSLSTATYPSQNFDTAFNFVNFESQYGALRSSTPTYDGYICEVVLIDGQQLDPTSFGEFDSSSGVWKPISVSNLTFGDNGYYLDFEDSSDLGQDVSGNNNDFSLTNIATTDQSADTCTNNWCTGNPLYVMTQFANTGWEEGALAASNRNTSNNWGGEATFRMESGKWYWEVKVGANMGNGANFGIWTDGPHGHADTGQAMYQNSGTKQIDGSSTSYGASYTDDDILSFSYDADNGILVAYKNGVSQGNLFTAGSGKIYVPSFGIANGSLQQNFFNFGNSAATIASGNSDGNGYGNFEYAVPSGFYALNTKNLAEFG